MDQIAIYNLNTLNVLQKCILALVPSERNRVYVFSDHSLQTKAQ